MDKIEGFHTINLSVVPNVILNQYIENADFNLSLFHVTENNTPSLEKIIKYFSKNDYPEKYVEFYYLESNFANLKNKITTGKYLFFDENENLTSALKSYNDGFLKGYENLNEKIINSTEIFNQKSDLAFHIFSIIHNNKYDNGFIGNEFEEKNIDYKNRPQFVQNSDFYEYGLKGGEFYKSWFLILKNPLVFEAIFEKYYSKQKTDETEKNNNIFSNNGFILFDHILTEYIKQNGFKGRYEDLSYYYRRLFKDKFIHQKPEPFREWFQDEFDEIFSKIKTIEQTENKQRKENYSNALNWFKSQ